MKYSGYRFYSKFYSCSQNKIVQDIYTQSITHFIHKLYSSDKTILYTHTQFKAPGICWYFYFIQSHLLCSTIQLHHVVTSIKVLVLHKTGTSDTPDARDPTKVWKKKQKQKTKKKLSLNKYAPPTPLWSSASPEKMRYPYPDLTRA